MKFHTAMQSGRGLAIVSLAVLVLAGCHKKPGAAPAAADARTVRVTPVESRAMAGGLVASGLMVSREEAAVGSDITGYRVSTVNVEQGAWVRKGQPLVQLDDTLLQAQIEQAKAQAQQADDQAKRVAGLDSAGVLSEEQIETRRIQARVSQAALHDLEVRESHMIVRAPVGGLVLERNVRPGDIASAGGATPMFRIARDGLIELNAEVAEDAFGHIRIGDPVSVTLPNEAVVSGRVRLIDPLVDAQTKLGRVRVQLPVRADLRPGGFGRGTFAGVSVAQMAIPEKAIRYDADGASVMALGPDNRVRQEAVRTGRRAAGYVELLEGPPVGSKVLLGAASFVLPGDKVNPIDANAPTPAPPAAAQRRGG